MPKSALNSVLLLILLPACASTSDRRGDYYGEELPGLEPSLFAPGVISTAMSEWDTTISNDGYHILYSVTGLGWGTIIWLERRGDVLSAPRIAPFSGKHDDLEPAFVPGSTRLVSFRSDRSLVARRATTGISGRLSWTTVTGANRDQLLASTTAATSSTHR